MKSEMRDGPFNGKLTSDIVWYAEKWLLAYFRRPKI